MPTTLKLKNSVTAAAAPSTLVQGEAAVNVTDKKVWVGNAASSPVQILGAGASLDGMAIGGTTAAAGAFTTLSATGVTTVQAGTVSAPAITTSGDTNTGIFFPAADTIAFTEGGVESMRIDSSGRVLIGSTGSVGNANANNLEITNPAGSGVCGLTLNVNSGSANTGNIYWRSNASNNAIQLVGDPITNYFAIATSGTERMRIDSSGNVGIGTSSPATKAEISGTAASANIALRITNTDASGYSTLQMGDGNAGIYRNGSSQSGYAGTSSLNLITVGAHNIGFSTQNTLRAIIDSSGNVGIGTSSPTARVHAYSSTAMTQLTVDGAGTIKTGINFANSGNTYGQIYFDNNSPFDMSVLQQVSIGSLRLGTNNTERMRIDSSGRVGIGTSSPAYQLTIAGYSNANAANKFAIGSTADYQALFYYESGQETFTIENTSDYANSAIIFKTNNAERMRITSGGEVRIGTTDITNGGFSFEAGYNGTGKSAALFGHITGTGSGNQYCIFYYDGTTIGSITQNGTTAVAYNTTSDYRLKENIAPMTNALAKVAQLKPVTYTWKADGSDGQGFIAHELQAVVPDAVTGEKDAVDKDGKPTYQGVDTSYLVATLTAAIQEQQAMIEELKQEVAKLKGN